MMGMHLMGTSAKPAFKKMMRGKVKVCPKCKITPMVCPKCS